MKSITKWLAAVSVVALWSCGETTKPPDGGTSTCSSDATCATKQMCHPVSKRCVPTCDTAMDCPSASQSCAAVMGSTSKTCQCTGDGMCGASQVCQPFGLCTAKCAGASDCPSSYTCDTASGKCKLPSDPCGFGADAGTCTGGKLCDFAAGMCITAATCSTSNPQPDTCGYGNACVGTSCASAVSRPTCGNYTSANPAPSFNPATSTGPIIYKVGPAMPAVPTTNCFKGLTAAAWSLDLYRTDASNFPMQATALGGIWYVRTDGTRIDLTSMGFPASYYVANGKNASVRVYICGDVAPSLAVGFYLTGGNEVCTTASAGTTYAGTTDCTTNPQCGAGKTCNTANGTCM